MVRKQTWALLAVFVILLGAAFYLQKKPLPSGEKPTPSPTTLPLLFTGWKDSDIVKVDLKEAQGNITQVAQDDKGNWSLTQGSKKVNVEAGLVEQLRSQITSINVQAVLPAGYSLDALGLKSPANTVTIQNQQGKQAVLHIGSATPTDTGYYVQLDNNTPVVVDKTAIDDVLNQFKTMNPTPTPGPGTPTEGTPAATAGPTTTATP